MRLILFRHGIAVDREDPECPPDPDRFLTARGVRRTERAARGLKRLGIRPELVLTSPWLRARQTAEIAARELGFPLDEIAATESLLPGARPAALLRDLHAATGDVLCTGHAPHLDEAAAFFLGMRRGVPFALGKAGALCIELTPGESDGRLVWFLEPRALRALGG